MKVLRLIAILFFLIFGLTGILYVGYDLLGYGKSFYSILPISFVASIAGALATIVERRMKKKYIALQT